MRHYTNHLTPTQLTALYADIEDCLTEVYTVNGEEEIGQSVSHAHKELNSKRWGSTTRRYRWTFSFNIFESVVEEMGFKVTAGRTVRRNLPVRVIHV